MSAEGAAPSSPFGVQLLTRATDPNFMRVLAQARALGVRWVRVDLAWYSIQPLAPATPGCDNCDWTYPDLLFSTLAAQGLTPIVTLWGSPSWAATHPNGPIKPVNLSDFGNFVYALAQRYPNVQYWEFYNEPDGWASLDESWGGEGKQYAAMLATAYNAIHPKGAQGAGGIPQYVVFGGIAYEPKYACQNRPKGQCFDNNFVEDVLGNANGSPLFDMMAFHSYAAFAGNYSPPNVIGKALELKQRYPFLENKPFLVTELGKGYEYGSDPNYSHELTARQVVQMFTAMMAAKAYGVNILAGTWFTLEHNEGLAGKVIRKWGLLDEAGNPWPLEGGAYRTVVNELSKTDYLGPVGGGGAIEGYDFAAPDGSIHSVLWATGSPVSFSFPGATLRWLDERGAATTVVDNASGDGDARRGWIGIEITPSPIFVETNIRISLPIFFDANSAIRGVQLRVLAILCQILYVPCNLN